MERSLRGMEGGVFPRSGTRGAWRVHADPLGLPRFHHVFDRLPQLVIEEIVAAFSVWGCAVSTGNVLHPKALNCSCREPPRSLPENKWINAGMCRDEGGEFLVAGVVGPPEGSAGWPAVRSDAAGSSGGRKGRWLSVGLFFPPAGC